MTNLKVKERFYFSYSKKESDFLKEKGLFYITKAIHPQSNVCFTMWDRNEDLLTILKEFNQLHKNVN
ncbi:hypothetical protein P9E76_15375 [Schinkia azotoformans]|uniref:DUF5659 domain-containing protein n=1 Tax=Schinkia azotoformans LMG 9581 TaxID=1131731 RepID=K6DIY5_SCHAZ|nr:hypothetical protein [Schinkia azotoformans]EKN68053.1 hypothetical protein BAZO_06034 [Schinkia azotoformans LMG 9581]MEC1638141.1 hypothetical protein [Schinkia azotoformans]MEC1946425.1 hypothetical protein [Schinkia azotoformans]